MYTCYLQDRQLHKYKHISNTEITLDFHFYFCFSFSLCVIYCFIIFPSPISSQPKAQWCALRGNKRFCQEFLYVKFSLCIGKTLSKSVFLSWSVICFGWDVSFVKNKVWKNAILCFIQAGIICHTYCYYLFSWIEEHLQFVSIWSLWLFTLFPQESFHLLHRALSSMNGLSASVNTMIYPGFCFVSYRLKKAR